MKAITTLSELLSKLNKVNFTSTEHKKLISDTFSLSLSYKMHETRGNFPAWVQIIARVTYQGQLVVVWGCMEDDNITMIDWFLKKETEISKANYKAGTKLRFVGEDLLNSL